MTDRRGVSEIIGFVLIFSLISVSVGAVYVVGFSGLQDARDAEQLENVERAFDVLDDNMDDIVSHDAPNRATEFRLYEADLFVGDPTRFNVTVTNVNEDLSNRSYTVSAYPVVYEAQASPTTIRYVNGAVIREDRNGVIFLNDPRFVFRRDGPDDNRTTVLPFVDTRTRGPTTVGGTGTVLVRADRVIGETLDVRTPPTTATTDPDGDGTNEYEIQVRITTTPTRATIWNEYLEEELTDAYPSLSDPCTLSAPDTVECTFPSERLYLTITRVDVTVAG